MESSSYLLYVRGEIIAIIPLGNETARKLEHQSGTGTPSLTYLCQYGVLAIKPYLTPML